MSSSNAGRPAGSAAAGREAGSAEPTVEQRAAAAAVLRMISGIHISRAVYVAAELGIADHLADGPMSAGQLARATQAHEPSLYRVLRLLASLGVLAEQDDRSFGLTVLGERLRTGVPASVRSWAMLVDVLGGVGAFEPVIETVRTGKPGFNIARGMTVHEFFARHPQQAQRFQAAMSERTGAVAPAVAAGYDFSRMRTVADIGGGTGTLLAAILRAHGHLRGVLFERPAVAAHAAEALEAAGVADRCQIVAGDFFDGVPQGADGYILATVLLDWDDARAVQILANCRRAMASGGRLLIIERLIADNLADAVPVLLSDLNMLIFTDGQERTNAEYGRLLTEAGLSPGTVQPVATLFEHGKVALQILTSDFEACPAEILSWLKSRWREENFLKYASVNYGIDKICDYLAGITTNTKITDNPARKAASAAVRDAEKALAAAERDLAGLLADPAITPAVKNARLPALQKAITRARTKLAAATAARKPIPAKLPANAIDPGARTALPRAGRRSLQMVLRLLAHNAEHWLSNHLNAYLRDDDEYGAITRETIIRGLAGTITFTPAAITVHLERPPAPRVTRALTLLIQEINATPPAMPGDRRPITYQLAPRPGI